MLVAVQLGRILPLSWVNSSLAVMFLRSWACIQAPAPLSSASKKNNNLRIHSKVLQHVIFTINTTVDRNTLINPVGPKSVIF